MGNFLQTLFGNMLSKMNLYQVLMIVYRIGGRDAVKRFATMPESVAQRVPTVVKNPAKLAVVEQEVHEFADAAVELLDACIDDDFTEPDGTI